VRTAGFTATAPTAVVAAGPWAADTLAGLLDLPELTVTREQVFYFRPVGDAQRWPCFVDRGDPSHYGLRTSGRGIKVGEHHTGAAVSADGRSFDCDEDGRQRVQDYVRRALPGLDPGSTSYETCLYTSTHTEDFVVTRDGPLVAAAGFSGHGFKFTPLIGRLLADAADGTAAIPIGMWSGDGGQRSDGSHL
jgi:sarcosine oxidase